MLSKNLKQWHIIRKEEVLRSLRHYLQAQSQGHHTIDLLEERGVERESAQRSSLKGGERAIVSQTNIGTTSKASLGKLLRDGVERIWAFPRAEIPSWTEMNLNWKGWRSYLPRVWQASDFEVYAPCFQCIYFSTSITVFLCHRSQISMNHLFWQSRTIIEYNTKTETNKGS